MPIKIDTRAIAALRDRLLETGGAPSILVAGPEALDRRAHPMEGDDEAIALFEAAFEAMFIMLASDGVVSERERIVLRGAIRALTAGALPTREIDRLAATSVERIKAEGVAARLREVALVLKGHRVAAEAAFVLAATMAFADGKIEDAESETLDTLAELVDIDVDRANELLDELETPEDPKESAPP